MKSYGRASAGVLGTLLRLRVDGERAAEQLLATAAAARRTAEAEEARLAAQLEAARAAIAAARRDRDGGGNVGNRERAVDAQGRRRFWARLEAQAGAAAEAVARHRTQALARAIDAEAAARAAHLRARQRREVVEKAIARREAVARREAERREDAEIDDRYAGARARTNTPTTGK